MLDGTVMSLIVVSLLTALVTAPIGCLVMWHRLAFLSDTIGHASILGVTIAMMYELNAYAGVVATSLLVILLIVQIQKNHSIISDSILAIVSQVGMAGGVLLLASHSVNEGHVHVEDLLFGGEVQELGKPHIVALIAVVVFILLVLYKYWKKLLLISMSWEISQAEGLSVQKHRFIMYLLMALLVTVLIKIMGVLLIASLLIIPASAVRWLSSSPEKMVVYAFGFTLISIVAGLSLAQQFDLLSGPFIVLMAASLLLISQFTKKLLNRH